MRVISKEQVLLRLSDLGPHAKRQSERGFPSTHERSGGVHVSGILRYIATTSGLLRVDDDEDLEALYPMRMALGQAWETFAQGLWENLIWQPGEIERDGIVGSPDGLSITDDESILDEFKLTYKSFRKHHPSIHGQWLWTRQMLSYCFMMGLSKARLHVLWINGMDDSFQTKPTYYTYLFEFEQRELERHWTLMVQNRDKAKPELWSTEK